MGKVVKNWVRTKSDGGLKFPPTIPKERSGSASYIMLSIGVLTIGCMSAIIYILLKINIYKNLYRVGTSFHFVSGAILLVEVGNGLIFTCASTSLFILSFAGVELVKRTCHLVEELGYLKSRYESLTHLLSNVFSFEIKSILIMSASLISTTMFCLMGEGFHYNSNAWAMMLAFLGVNFLLPFCNFHNSPLYDSLRLARMKGMDYGSSMAQSFFNGYLKIMLPSNERDGGGLKHLLEVYENDNRGVEFQMYKLQILVPMSMHCPPSLKESGNIREAKPLESVIINRAGVQKRVYKNSIYKVDYKVHEDIYVCAEYATPVKTLYEAMNSGDRSAPFYKEHHKDILLNFYLTCKRLIEEDKSTRDLCELVFFDDRDKAKVDVAVLLAENVVRHLDKVKLKTL